MILNGTNYWCNFAASKKYVMKEAKAYKTNDELQHLILKIRIAVATEHLELLPKLNSEINKIWCEDNWLTK